MLRTSCDGFKPILYHNLHTSCDTYGKSKINKSHTSSKPPFGAPFAATFSFHLLPRLDMSRSWATGIIYKTSPRNHCSSCLTCPFLLFFLIFGLIWTHMWFILCCLSIYLLSLIHLLEGWIVELGLLALFIPKGWFERRLAELSSKTSRFSEYFIISLGGKFPTCLADLVVNLCKSTVFMFLVLHLT